MRTRASVGVMTRPIDINANITVGAGGALKQTFDATKGEYSPDRRLTPTILQLEVYVNDPQNSDADAGRDLIDFTDIDNHITWRVDGQPVTSTSETSDYYLDDDLLVIRRNVPTKRKRRLYRMYFNLSCQNRTFAAA